MVSTNTAEAKTNHRAFKMDVATVIIWHHDYIHFSFTVYSFITSGTTNLKGFSLKQHKTSAWTQAGGEELKPKTLKFQWCKLSTDDLHLLHLETNSAKRNHYSANKQQKQASQL